MQSLIKRVDRDVRVRRQPEMVLHALVPSQLVEGKVAEPEAHIRSVRYEFCTLLLLSQRLLRLLALGYVARGAEPFENFVVFGEEWNGAGVNPTPRTVGANHAMLQLKDGFRLDRALNHCHHMVLIIAMDVFVNPGTAPALFVGGEFL